ncbi:MAG TPA: PEP-CTERM sorting domain-containing protein [Rhodopila sp.]
MARFPFRYTFLSGAALLVMTPGFAYANVTYSDPFAKQSAGDFGEGTGSLTVTLPAFNPTTDGVLSGIVITLATNATASFQTSNSNPTTSFTFTNGHFSGDIVVSYTLDGSLSVLNTLAASGFSGTANAATPVQLFSAPPLSASNSSSVAAGNFANYESTAGSQLTFDVSFGGFAAAGTKQPGAGTALTFGATGSISGIVTITYETVPEPASMSLIGGGLVGLGVLRRRRNHAAA